MSSADRLEQDTHRLRMALKPLSPLQLPHSTPVKCQIIGLSNQQNKLLSLDTKDQGDRIWGCTGCQGDIFTGKLVGCSLVPRPSSPLS